MPTIPTVTPLGIIDSEAGLAPAGTGDIALAEECDPELEAILEAAPPCGDTDFPSLEVEASTYRQSGKGDAVMEIAASRMGSSISDAAIVLGKDLVLSGKLSIIFDRLIKLTAEKRRDALLDIAANVSISGDTVSITDSTPDFKVLILRDSAVPLGDRHLRQYRFFLHDGTQAKVVYARCLGHIDRQMRERQQSKNKGNLAGLLERIRFSLVERAQSVSRHLISARELAIGVEAISRELRVESNDSKSTLAGLEEDEMFDILWELMAVARDTTKMGSGLPMDFDANTESLKVFLLKPGR